MKAIHGFQYITEIPKENAEMIIEFCKRDNLIKKYPKKEDKAQQYTIKLQNVTIVLSKKGEMQIFTDLNKKELLKVLKNSGIFGKKILKIIEKNLRNIGFGIHCPKEKPCKISIKKYIVLIPTKTGEKIKISLIFVTAVCNKYYDFHIYISSTSECNKYKTSLEPRNKNSQIKDGWLIDVRKERKCPLPPPSRITEDLINKIAEDLKNNNPSIVDIKYIMEKYDLNYTKSRRILIKLEKRGLLKRISRYPITFKVMK